MLARRQARCAICPATLKFLPIRFLAAALFPALATFLPTLLAPSFLLVASALTPRPLARKWQVAAAGSASTDQESLSMETASNPVSNDLEAQKEGDEAVESEGTALIETPPNWVTSQLHSTFALVL